MSDAEKLELAKKCLSFYADMDNYQHVGSGMDPEFEAVNRVDRDSGSRARSLLEVLSDGESR